MNKEENMARSKLRGEIISELRKSWNRADNMYDRMKDTDAYSESYWDGQKMALAAAIQIVLTSC